MKRILCAIIGLTASTLVSANMAVCQKNCGISFGQCVITTFDMKSCLQAQASCALECLKSVKVEHKHHHHDVTPEVKSELGVCQKNCGIDFGKCLIQTFDMKTCAQSQVVCALDCLKGVAFVAKYDKPVVALIENSVGNQGVCQKNCGISFGQCLITTFNPKSCLAAQASCALECLKSVKVEHALSKLQVKDMGVCQKNCGLSFGQCLIQTFDMKSCTLAQASCALECLKSVKVEKKHPHVKSLKCTACKFAAGKIESVLTKYGCGPAEAFFTSACETVFLGSEDPLSNICTAGFTTACPTLLSWIENKAYTASKACALIHMC